MPNRRQRRLLKRVAGRLAPMAANCAELRERVVAAKEASNEARTANAEAATAGKELPYGDAAIIERRSTLHMAALRAREAGCNIDDLVGPNVGDRDSSL